MSRLRPTYRALGWGINIEILFRPTCRAYIAVARAWFDPAAAKGHDLLRLRAQSVAQNELQLSRLVTAVESATQVIAFYIELAGA